jgi:hypothetical protein
VERFTPVRAREVLTEELARVDWNAASAFTIEEGARPETERLDWWHSNTPENERSDTLRNLAYLRAYVRIANGQRMWAGGIKLSRRTLCMDRSVMSRLERDGYVQFVEGRSPYFQLTELGEQWIGSE